MRYNSDIYKDPEENHLFDLSSIGMITHEDKTIEISQNNHFFKTGDVLYFNVKTGMFAKAIAVNGIESEVCGVVSEVISKDSFTIVTKGSIQTDEYTFDVNTPLYLSNAHAGRLTSIPPYNVIKQVAIQDSSGILVDIQRGMKTTETSSSEELESYTKAELDEIIKNIW